MIKIQREDFNIDYEVNLIKSKYTDIGATSIFIGSVRDLNQNKKVKSINLEVYEEMAIKSLSEICKNAQKKWQLIDSLVIHRFGNLFINDNIVLVATFSLHRQNSDKACTYIMNYLKQDAPFWKKEFYQNSSAWI